MTQPGTEPWSLGSLVNTLTTRAMDIDILRKINNSPSEFTEKLKGRNTV